MEPWVIYALLSTFTGGAALVFAKMGMRYANEHIALVIRTSVLFAVILTTPVAAGGCKGASAIPSKALWWFILAGITTAVYWIRCFKALKTADVSVVSTIDKGGIIVTFLLVIGAVLILSMTD